MVVIDIVIFVIGIYPASGGEHAYIVFGHCRLSALERKLTKFGSARNSQTAPITCAEYGTDLPNKADIISRYCYHSRSTFQK